MPVPAPVPAGPAFELSVRAPEAARELLLRHLPLLRFRDVPDLDATELARLLALAERDTRELLATLGWFRPQIGTDIDHATRPPQLRITVDPGPQTQVRSVEIGFAGDIATNPAAEVAAQREAIRAGWGLQPGQPFTQDAWSAAKSQAARTLVARRYLLGRIATSLADVDAASGQARLGLRLDSGPRVLLGPMEVSGLRRYDPRLVPRLARLPAGSEYDQDAIAQAQLRLTASGWFESAFIVVDGDGDPAAAPVQVTVREARLQRATVGLGVSTDSGPRLSLEHRHNRVPGIGWRADTTLKLERRAPSLQTDWSSIPDERGWRWGTLARAEWVRDDGGQVTRTQRLRLGRSFSGERIERSVYAQLDRSDVQAPGSARLAPEDAGDGSALTANYTWSGRYFDRLPNPTRGHAFGLELGAGFTLTGARAPFQRTLVRALLLHPVRQGRVQLRGEAGAVLASGAARVPAAQLFRTGGDTTVRGYTLREIGVERSPGVVSPGRYLAVAIAEWQRPLRLQGALANLEQTLFVDAGAVADSPGALRPSVGVGTGLRLNTPVGALQADIAYGVQARRLRLHLNVGVVF